MAEEVLSIAFVRPFEGQDEEVVALAGELYALLERKQYSRDLLYRDRHDPHLLVTCATGGRRKHARRLTRTLKSIASGRAWDKSAKWKRCTSGWKRLIGGS